MIAHPAQLTFDFRAPVPAAATSIAKALIDAGLAPNEYILEVNRGLTVPYDFDLSPPWSLPSRAFRFPLEYMTAARRGGTCDALLLRHPALADHPFMATVAAAIGVPPTFEPCDEFGRDITSQACWWHAADLMSEARWRALLDTRRFTTDDCLTAALASALEYPASYEGRGKKCGLILPATARLILAELGHPEPVDRSRALLLGPALFAGEISTNENGKPCATQYPLNRMQRGAAGAWMMVHGLEDGWFVRDRGRYLQIGVEGRAKRSASAEMTAPALDGESQTLHVPLFANPPLTAGVYP